MTLAKRLRVCMEQQHLSVAEAARKSGVPAYFVHDILNEKSTNPAPTRLAKLADTLGVALDYLIGSTANPAPQGMVTIPTLRVEQTSPKKKPIFTEVPTQSGYSFQRDWVNNRLKANLADLKLVELETDNMAPTLKRGDHVLIDASRRTPSPLGMFVLFDGMGLVVQRLERLGKNDLIRVSSDNATYPHKDIPLGQLDIVGRVVWYAHEL